MASKLQVALKRADAGRRIQATLEALGKEVGLDRPAVPFVRDQFNQFAVEMETYADWLEMYLEIRPKAETKTEEAKTDGKVQAKGK